MSKFRLETTKLADPGATLPMILHCPQCSGRHVDEGNFLRVAHHTHACQHCGFVWRPAVVNTHGVQFLPGFKNEGAPWVRAGVRELAAPPPDTFEPENEG